MARPARRHARAGRPIDVHVIPACAESGVLWKIHGGHGGAAWLPPAVAGWFTEIEQSTRAAFPADRRRRHPLRRVLGLAGHSSARQALLLPGPGRRRAGPAGARTGPDPGDARPAAGSGPQVPPPSRRPAPPRNVSFYQSLGFQIAGEQQAPDGGPVTWFTQTPRTPSSQGSRRCSGGAGSLPRTVTRGHG